MCCELSYTFEHCFFKVHDKVSRAMVKDPIILNHKPLLNGDFEFLGRQHRSSSEVCAFNFITRVEFHLQYGFMCQSTPVQCSSSSSSSSPVCPIRGGGYIHVHCTPVGCPLLPSITVALPLPFWSCTDTLFLSGLCTTQF